VHSEIWEIDGVHFPIIRLVIKDPIGTPRVGVVLNLRNFDYGPPSATLMDIHFKRYLVPEDVPATTEGTPDGRSHIMFNQITRRCWFCSPGLQEYHDLYPEDPWELIRSRAQGSIISIVNNICNLIDRRKWSIRKEE